MRRDLDRNDWSVALGWVITENLHAYLLPSFTIAIVNPDYSFNTGLAEALVYLWFRIFERRVILSSRSSNALVIANGEGYFEASCGGW